MGLFTGTDGFDNGKRLTLVGLGIKLRGDDFETSAFLSNGDKTFNSIPVEDFLIK
jgi:hypothetical protein